MPLHKVSFYGGTLFDPASQRLYSKPIAEFTPEDIAGLRPSAWRQYYVRPMRENNTMYRIHLSERNWRTAWWQKHGSRVIMLKQKGKEAAEQIVQKHTFTSIPTPSTTPTDRRQSTVNTHQTQLPTSPPKLKERRRLVEEKEYWYCPSPYSLGKMEKQTQRN
jgi:hypothetical protein